MDKPADPATPLAEVYQSFLDDLARAGSQPSYPPTQPCGTRMPARIARLCYRRSRMGRAFSGSSTTKAKVARSPQRPRNR